LRAELERQAESVAAGRVMFLGALEDPRPALAAADVLVLPSETEGIPAVLIEAAFSELPVVATLVGGVPEIVVNGETGVLVPRRPEPTVLAGAIRAAAKERQAMGRAARLRCLERFEIGVVAARWDALLEELGGWDAPQ